MTNMCSVGFMVILSCIFYAGDVDAGLTGGACATPTEIARVQELAGAIIDMQARLPEIDYSNDTNMAMYDGVLQMLCTQNKSLLLDIQTIIASCPAMILAVPELMQIKVLGKTFSIFYLDFADIDEFCDCSSYLLPAWVFAERLQIAKTNKADPDLHSQTRVLSAYCSDERMRSKFTRVVAGLSSCRPLPGQAGLSTAAQATDVNAFMTDGCPTYDAGKLECAMDKAEGSDFKSCYANPDYTNDAMDEKARLRCGRRNCVTSATESACGTLGRDLYIDAINLHRENDAREISAQDCDTSGAPYIRLSAIAALGTVLLYIVV